MDKRNGRGEKRTLFWLKRGFIMDKRGQVYILAAIILSFLIIALATKMIVVQREKFESDFYELSSNYDKESAKFMNILAEKRNEGEIETMDVVNLSAGFARDFSIYSKTQNPYFGLLYFFDYDDKVIFGNYLNQDVLFIVCERPGIVKGCRSKISAGAEVGGWNIETSFDLGEFVDCLNVSASGSDVYSVYFLVGDYLYNTELKKGITEIAIISNEAKNEQRRVFVDRFINGEYIDISSICKNKEINAGGLIDLSEIDLSEEGGICNCDGGRDLSKEDCEINSYCKWDENKCEEA